MPLPNLDIEEARRIANRGSDDGRLIPVVIREIRERQTYLVTLRPDYVGESIAELEACAEAADDFMKRFDLAGDLIRRLEKIEFRIAQRIAQKKP